MGGDTGLLEKAGSLGFSGSCPEPLVLLLSLALFLFSENREDAPEAFFWPLKEILRGKQMRLLSQGPSLMGIE